MSFQRVVQKVARERDPKTGQPYGEERARRIVAAGARGASPGAKRRNPSLKKVK